MKILFITLGRTGSTNLCKGLSKTLSLDFLDEPFNKINAKLFDHYYSKIKNSESIIVKHIISQTNESSSTKYLHEGIVSVTTEDFKYNEFIKKLIKEFDYVISLGRKNIKEHYESLCNLRYRNETNQSGHQQYQFESIPEQFKTYYSSILTIEKLQEYHDKIENIADKNKLTKLYYEDVYSHNIEKNYKKIKSILPFVNENLKKYLDRKNKLRVAFVKKSII